MEPEHLSPVDDVLVTPFPGGKSAISGAIRPPKQASFFGNAENQDLHRHRGLADAFFDAQYIVCYSFTLPPVDAA